MKIDWKTIILKYIVCPVIVTCIGNMLLPVVDEIDTSSLICIIDNKFKTKSKTDLVVDNFLEYNMLTDKQKSIFVSGTNSSMKGDIKLVSTDTKYYKIECTAQNIKNGNIKFKILKNAVNCPELVTIDAKLVTSGTDGKIKLSDDNIKIQITNKSTKSLYIEIR